MIEIWEEIDGFEGLYFISNFGRIKSLKHGKEKILKSYKNYNGNLNITLTLRGKKFIFILSRLVAFYFIKNKDNCHYVTHIDKNRENNMFTNLLWTNKNK